jgi:DNA-binding NarL/FixJ family response regulator
MRVLLATKDQNLRISLQLLISEEPGLRVVGTASETNGLQALISTTHPDLVIVDWDLPGRNVGELLEETKNNSQPGKFIVLGRDAEDKSAALDRGAHDFVHKAAPPENLLNAIHRTLGLPRTCAGENEWNKSSKRN